MPKFRYTLLGALALGFLLPALMSWVIPVGPQQDPHKQGYPEWSWLAAQTLALLGVSLTLAVAPITIRGGWSYLETCLRLIAWLSLACLGLKCSPWAQLHWDTAFSLAALLSSQALFVTGLCAVTAWVFGFAPRISRMILTLLIGLMATGILWTRPHLLTLYRQHPEWAMPVTQTLVEFSPVTATASAWNNSESPIDLFKCPLAYDLWIGSYQPVSYARLWPQSAEDADTPRAPEQDSGFVNVMSWKFFMLFRRICTALGLVGFNVLVGVGLVIGIDWANYRSEKSS